MAANLRYPPEALAAHHIEFIGEPQVPSSTEVKAFLASLEDIVKRLLHTNHNGEPYDEGSDLHTSV